MEIKLEKKELLALLSKGLGYELKEEDIEIKTRPFHIIIKNVRVGEMAQATPRPAATDSLQVRTVETSETEELGIRPSHEVSDDSPSMGSILGQSEDLARAGVPGVRPLGPTESHEPPPPGTEFGDED